MTRVWSAHLHNDSTNGLTDTLSSCYSHALSITTDSEEKRHGGTSQEVSQEVREQERKQAKRIETSRGIRQAHWNEGTSRQTRRRNQEKNRREAPGDQEERVEASNE